MDAVQLDTLLASAVVEGVFSHGLSTINTLIHFVRYLSVYSYVYSYVHVCLLCIVLTVYCFLYVLVVSKLYSFLEAFVGGRGVALGTRHGGAVTRWPSAVSLPGGGFGMNATIGQQQQQPNPASRSNSTATLAGALAAVLNEQAIASATYAPPDQLAAGEHDICSAAADPSVRSFFGFSAIMDAWNTCRRR